MAGAGNASVMTAIYRLIAALAQDRQERTPPATDSTRRLDLFERRNPPHFKGDLTLKELEYGSET